MLIGLLIIGSLAKSLDLKAFRHMQPGLFLIRAQGLSFAHQAQFSTPGTGPLRAKTAAGRDGALRYHYVASGPARRGRIPLPGLGIWRKQTQKPRLRSAPLLPYCQTLRSQPTCPDDRSETGTWCASRTEVRCRFITNVRTKIPTQVSELTLSELIAGYLPHVPRGVHRQGPHPRNQTSGRPRRHRLQVRRRYPFLTSSKTKTSRSATKSKCSSSA